MIKIDGSNVTIIVKNMNKAIKFYENIGLTLQQRWGNHYAMIGTEGVTLGIHPAEKKKNSSGTVSIGFMVKDINEAKALLAKHKIKYKFFDDEGASGLYLHFTDLDGTLLYFTQPKWK
jgi:catechol 2,3-dioxygenase-like lactoylglutathione lyase family enzyme